MTESLSIRNSESHFTNEQIYRVSPDLQTACDYVIPGWDSNKPGQQEVILHLAKGEINEYRHLNMRSRMAQAGLTFSDYTRLNKQEMLVHLLNFSPRAIGLQENTGISCLYSPSRPAQGRDLIAAVLRHIDVDYDHVVFADLEGNTWLPDQVLDDMQGVLDSLTYLGIQTDTSTLLEINPEQEQLEIGVVRDVRQDASNKLRHSNGHTQTPFGITTTAPISVNGTFLTLVNDTYGDLKHLPSQIIHPNRSQWQSNGDNSGIRLEYYSQTNKALTRTQLPPYAFFTVHPLKN